jgi:hypothetical protein
MDPDGGLSAVYRPDRNPCASGLKAITSRPWFAAYGSRSSSGLRRAKLYCTWLDSTGRPSAASAARQRLSE